MDEEINEHELGFSGQASGDSLPPANPDVFAAPKARSGTRAGLDACSPHDACRL